MSGRRLGPLALLAVAGAGCLFQPDLSRYPECAVGDVCAAGATCVLPERRCIPDCVGPTCPEVDAGADAGEVLFFVGSGLDAGVEFQPFEHVFTVDGGTPPYRYRAAAALPPGLSLSDAGVLSGAPEDAGVLRIVPEVEDSSTPPHTRAVEFRWEVRPLLRLAGPRQLADAVVGSAYADVLSSTGGVSPHLYEVVDGGLPEGLVLSPDGGVSGTASGGTGTFAVEVRVTDSAQPPQRSQLPVTILVEPYNPLPPLELQTRSLPEGRLGAAYTYRLQAHGGVPPYTWFITNLPDGLSPDGPVISGTPQERVSAKSIGVQVTDSAIPTSTDSTNFSLTIR